MYLIIRKDRLLTHIGLYLENFGILHYASLTNNFWGKDKAIKTDTLASFSMGRIVKIIPISKKISNDYIVSKAFSFPGAIHEYHIIHNNCYTFVLWCLYGQKNTRLSDILSFASTYRIPLFSFFIL